MDVAPWCYKCFDRWDWISLGGVRYRALYFKKKCSEQEYLYGLKIVRECTSWEELKQNYS